jgi:hypothetical protein
MTLWTDFIRQNYPKGEYSLTLQQRGQKLKDLAVKYQQQYPINYAKIGRKTVEQRENAKIRN